MASEIVGIKEVLTDLQHLEAVYDEVQGRVKILQTFRAFLTGLQLGAAGGFINVFAVPASAKLLRLFQAGEIAKAVEVQRRLNRCFPRGGEEALGQLGTTKVTASVVTGIDMGPARPPSWFQTMPPSVCVSACRSCRNCYSGKGVALCSPISEEEL